MLDEHRQRNIVTCILLHTEQSALLEVKINLNQII